MLGPLTAGARVLVAGAGVTGRSVLAALARLDVRAELTDDNEEALRTLAGQGVAVVSAGDVQIGDYAVVVPDCPRPRRC